MLAEAKSEVRKKNAEQIFSTVVFVIFRDNLIPIVWKSIVPIKAMKNLEKSKPDFVETQITSIHEVGKLNGGGVTILSLITLIY